MKNNSSENVSSDNETQKLKLVQVNAQVMRWDNSTGLWGQCAGGGMSRVYLFKVFESTPKNIDLQTGVTRYCGDCKPPSSPPYTPPSYTSSSPKTDIKLPPKLNISPPTTPTTLAPITDTISPPTPHTPSIHTTSIPFHYSILAHRIRDQATLINCGMSSEVEYSRATRSMLHHWSLGESRYGLTFQSSHDATIFQSAVLAALDVLRKQKEDLKYHDGSRLPTSPSLPLSNKEFDTPKKRVLEVKSSSSSLNLHSSSIPPTKNLPSISSQHHSPLLLLPHPHIQSPILVPPSPSPTLVPPTPPTPPSPLLHYAQVHQTSKHVVPPPRVVHGQPVCMPHRKPRAQTPPCSPEPQVILLSSFQSPLSSSNKHCPSSKPVTLDNFKYSNKIIISSETSRDDDDEEVFEGSRRDSSATESYVHLTKNAPPVTTVVPVSKHDYSYPTLYQATTMGSFSRSHSNPRMSLPISNSLSRRLLFSPDPSLNIIHPPSILPRKADRWSKSRLPWRRETIACNPPQRARCLYCQEYFSLGERQVCKDAPDKHLERIKAITCYPCLQGALYHCGQVEDERSVCVVRCRRGLLTSLVCLLLPCLCLYPFLHSCHSCSSHLTAPTHQRDIDLSVLFEF